MVCVMQGGVGYAGGRAPNSFNTRTLGLWLCARVSKRAGKGRQRGAREHRPPQLPLLERSISEVEVKDSLPDGS